MMSLRSGWFFIPLILLTLALLMFPVRFQLQYDVIESIHAFNSLVLFSVLYCVWLLILLILIWSKSGVWWHLALVSIFVLVYIAFWIIHTPYGFYEDLEKLSYVTSIQAHGGLPLPLQGYFQFPGSFLLANALSIVTGLDPLVIRTPLLIIGVLMLAGLCFVLYWNLLRNSCLAAVGTLLTFQANMMLSRFHFHPSYWGIIFILTFLVIISRIRSDYRPSVIDTLLLIIIMVAGLVTHFVSPLVPLFVLCGVYVLQPWRKKQSVSLIMLVLFVVMFLSYQIYVSILTFGGVVQAGLMIVHNFARDFQSYSGRVVSSNVAPFPMWANIVRFLWWALVYTVPVVLALFSFLNIGKLSLSNRRLLGLFTGILVLSALATVLSVGGDQFYRYILYGSFLSVPFGLSFLNTKTRLYRFLVPTLLVLICITSFPTFLSNNNRVITMANYPTEIGAGEFVKDTISSDTKNINVYWIDNSIGGVIYRIPDAHFSGMPQAPDLPTEENFRTAYTAFVDQFSLGVSQGSIDLFIVSKKLSVEGQHLYGISPDDRLWEDIKSSLLKSQLIYENGNVDIYARRALER